jgi:Asp/Glu/hydantoin racemase/predicted amidohydrolase
MARKICIAAAQMGATHLKDDRQKTLNRMLTLLDSAASQGAEVVLFPETAFTTFFPRHLINDPDELSSFFEHGEVTNSPNAKPLFDKARALGVDISVGFAESTNGGERFNSCVYYHAKSGSILSKYRKIHLPGDFEPFAHPNATNQLEKRYFKPGNLGFNAFRIPDLANNSEPIFGMMICNDRRWPEAWRCLGLQGVEVVLCGYNTAGYAPHLWGSDTKQDPKDAEETAVFHHKLVMQANSYMNATFSVCAARCGMDDGRYSLIGASCIVDPEGKILAEAKTKDDEVILAHCDLELCKQGKTRTFDFARHRRTEHYSRIVEQTGVIEPPHLTSTSNGIPNGTNGAHSATEIAADGTISGALISRKPIRILLINPNATPTMTANCLNMVQPTLPPDVEVTGFTAPYPAPTAIEGNVDNILSSAASFRAIIPLQEREGYDAMLVACYSDHALIRMLREEFDCPVIGIMEASLFAARTLGGRFGIVATSKRSKIIHEDAVRHYGMEGFCGGVEACEIGVLDLERKPRDEMLNVMQDVAKLLVANGAEVLTLGCAGMTDRKLAVEEAVGPDVQVVDGVVAGVQHLSGLVRMGGRTAKVGMYMSSATGRKKRGQEYV